MKATKSQQFKAVLSLTRWKEHVTFVVPLTVLGALLATRYSDINIDFRLVFVTLGNIGSVAYAFMINDIEDADDDSHDPHKAKRNPVSSKKISKDIAYAACRLVGISTLFFYFLSGSWVLWIGGFTLLLSHLYSWKPVRLKAWPVVDILSHSLMLSALLMLAGYYAYEQSPGVVWYVIAAATLFSVYGQLYNQIRDFTVDKKAGLKNTAILLGKARTQMLSYVSILFAIACLVVASFRGVFPVWLLVPLILVVFLSRKIRTKTDFTGSAVVDLSGAMQLQGVIVLNFITMLWLLQVVLTQIF